MSDYGDIPDFGQVYGGDYFNATDYNQWLNDWIASLSSDLGNVGSGQALYFDTWTGQYVTPDQVDPSWQDEAATAYPGSSYTGTSDRLRSDVLGAAPQDVGTAPFSYLAMADPEASIASAQPSGFVNLAGGLKGLAGVLGA